MNNLDFYETDEKSINGNYWKHSKFSKIDIDNYKHIYNLNEVIAKIISVRKIKQNDLRYLLRPTLKNDLPNPSILKNMESAVNALAEQIFNKNTIGILGDYDVDGATSSAIIYKYLKHIDIKTEVYIPDRIKDGYGVSKNSIDYFNKKKINFLITLDCGTNDTASITYAKKLGIEVLVIDHHEVKKIGNPLSIVNPKLKDDKSKLDILCTAGLAFLFIVAINRELKQKKLFTKIKEPNLKNYLDIVALGTICDLVPLKKINRLLVKKGLELVNSNSNKGLKVLKNKLCLSRKIKASDIAYYIGPCINAAGRIGNPYLGFSLLTTEIEDELNTIANKLITSNNERKTLEALAYEKAISLMKNQKKNNFIFVYSKNWHPGIIGIIASKLVEEYKVPAFVMSQSEEKIFGSVRSVKNIDISQILSKLVELGYVENGGGHAMAGGFKLKKENIENLKEYLDINNSIFFKKQYNVINIDLFTSISDIDINMIESLHELEPFGMDNPEPNFCIKSVSSTFSRKIGKDNKHLLCILEDKYGKKIKAIAFNSSSKKIGEILSSKKRFDVLGKVSINEWANNKEPQFLIEDLKIL